MFKTLITTSVLSIALFNSAAVVAETYHFLPINPNNNNIGSPTPVGSQLTVDVTAFGTTGALFTFTNPVGISSSIVDIYFSDPAPTVFTDYAITNQTSGVDFTLDTLSPANFPEGGPSFVEVASADAAGSGTNEIANGINALNESLTFTALFSTGNTFSSLIAAINAGDFRIALQTRDNTTGGNQSTDRWLNDTPVSEVPLPGAIWLFGSGLMGLVGYKRRNLR
jgi:hypothetical protein